VVEIVENYFKAIQTNYAKICHIPSHVKEMTLNFMDTELQKTSLPLNSLIVIKDREESS
jgi:hypothetical protein